MIAELRWLQDRVPPFSFRHVRTIVERLVPKQQRRVNTDPIAPYLDGLSLIRLGLRRPEEVEDKGFWRSVEEAREQLRHRAPLRL